MEPLTLAQSIFGKDFQNARILNERPNDLRSTNPDEDEILFRQYKALLRQQVQTIKNCLR